VASLLKVSSFFAEITQKRIRRSPFRRVPSPKKAIQSYLDQHNEDPKPFKWTADADLVLNRVANVCKRINNSRH